MMDMTLEQQELLYLREQNQRLIDALRKMERENDHLERTMAGRIAKRCAGWEREKAVMLTALRNHKGKGAA